VLTPGQRGEATQLEALVERGAVYQPLRCGRPRLRPRRLAGDKAYTGHAIRSFLRRLGIGAVIARQKSERGRGRRLDRKAYRKRNRIERLINQLKQFRRVATRYEKRAANYLAMLTLAAITLWL
jgi:transposase